MSVSLGDLTSSAQPNDEKEEMSAKDKALQYTLDQLFDSSNMIFKADLSKSGKFWFHMARVKTIADHYDLNVRSKFHQTILEHSVSISRKGRKEYIQLFQTLNENQDDEEDMLKQEKKRRLFG